MILGFIKMRRNSTMTLGFVLILIGIQLNVVQSYELTPRFSNFLSENGGSVVSNQQTAAALNQPFNSPYYQASHQNVTYNQASAGVVTGNVKTITTPNWLCWPVLFLGAVIFLHGIARRRD